MIRAAPSFVFLLAAMGPALVRADVVDGTNGVFGPGSTVGSDRWFAGAIRSFLAREAASASPGDLGGPLVEDHCRKPPALRGLSAESIERGRGRAASAASEPDRAIERGHRSVLARDLAGAVREYRAAVHLAGDAAQETRARLFLGAAYLARGETCAAIEELKLAARAGPSEPRVRLILGLALLWAGDAAGAQHELGVSPGADGDGLSDLLLGIAADARGEVGSALEAYRRYLTRVDEPEVRKRCEELRIAGKESNPARRELSKARGPRATSENPAAPDAKALTGSWRVLTSRTFYDQGGTGAQGRKATVPLEIEADGSWRFEGKTGRWAVSAIGKEDWDLWKISDYGPKRKISLEGWNGGSASGPIEESNGTVDFLWVIYRFEPASGPAGDAHLKLGR
jgi:tetratricopeptide (TPR) repeat protein